MCARYVAGMHRVAVRLLRPLVGGKTLDPRPLTLGGL